MTSASLAQCEAMFPWFFPTMAFIFGACIGSFLNVVIYRLPAEKSIVTPGSHCACGTPIAWYDNVPILSWFVLRGRARCCGRSYSFRYLFVEMLTALLFFACWLLFPHTHAKAAVGMGFVSVLVAAMFIDLGHMIIPDEFTLGAGVAGVVLSCLVPALHGVHGAPWMLTSMQAGVLSLRGLLVGSGFVLWVAMLAETTLRKEAMGMGDVKFVGMIGAFCGWRGAIFSFFGGAAVNLIWIAAALAWERLAGRAAAAAPKSEDADGEPVQLGVGAQVPFGPGIAVAGGLYFLFFEPPVTAWFGHFAALL